MEFKFAGAVHGKDTFNCFGRLKAELSERLEVSSGRVHDENRMKTLRWG